LTGELSCRTRYRTSLSVPCLPQVTGCPCSVLCAWPSLYCVSHMSGRPIKRLTGLVSAMTYRWHFPVATLHAFAALALIKALVSRLVSLRTISIITCSDTRHLSPAFTGFKQSEAQSSFIQELPFSRVVRSCPADFLATGGY